MTVTELNELQLNFLLARLIDKSAKVVGDQVFVDAPTSEFTLENPDIFKHVLLESRASIGPHIERGTFHGQYRAIVHSSLSLLDHDSYHGTVDAVADTPEIALGRAVLHALYGYEELPSVVEKYIP